MSRTVVAPSGSIRIAKGSSAVVLIGVSRRGVGRDNGSPETSPAKPHRNHRTSACPLLVSRTSSPMSVMFPPRSTIRLMLSGIAPPAR
jgi:hypothetical protein